MTQDDLKRILDLHKLWLEERPEGVRANLSRANLQGADLSRANLLSADLQDANVQYADLRGANLQYVNLQYADLRGADLSYANLQVADLQGADLQGANLQYANLRGADLQDANLQDANLQDAKLNNAIGNGRDIKTIVITPNTITIYKNNVCIGCEAHSIQHWLDNYAAIGKANNYTSEQIKEYGDLLKFINTYYIQETRDRQ